MVILRGMHPPPSSDGLQALCPHSLFFMVSSISCLVETAVTSIILSPWQLWPFQTKYTTLYVSVDIWGVSQQDCDYYVKLWLARRQDFFPLLLNWSYQYKDYANLYFQWHCNKIHTHVKFKFYSLFCHQEAEESVQAANSEFLLL